jgi:mannose-6-phosphate isomerase-like protein (cupin superfamily)
VPKFTKESLEAQDYGPVEDRQADADGYTFNYTIFKQDIDATPMMKGLPDDRCHCPHWGYVIKGKITFRFADHDEVVETGDAFYLPPGHIPVVEAGTEYIQFSPSKELEEVSSTIVRNMQAMQGA